MKRFRISTLMLLITIVALSAALMLQQRRAARREIGLKAELAYLKARLDRSFFRVEVQNDERARLLQTVQELTRKLIDLEVAAKRSGEEAQTQAKRGESTQKVDCE